MFRFVFVCNVFGWNFNAMAAAATAAAVAAVTAAAALG